MTPDITARLAEALRKSSEIIKQLVACHEEPTCPAVAVSAEYLAANDAALSAHDEQRASGSQQVAGEPVAVPGAVWGAYGEDGVCLIQRGTEDDFVSRKGGERIYRLAAPPDRRELTDDDLDALIPPTPFKVGFHWAWTKGLVIEAMRAAIAAATGDKQ